MAAVGGYEVGFERVSALLFWASTTQSFESWIAENIVTAVGCDLGLSVELEHYGQHVEGQDKEMTLRATQVSRREEGKVEDHPSPWRRPYSRRGEVVTRGA